MITSTNASSGEKTSVRCVVNRSETKTSDGRQGQRDLQGRVDDHRDREVGLVAGGQLNADDVLDGVPGDRDDHEAGEDLAHVQRVDRRRERIDEPVRRERGGAHRPPRARLPVSDTAPARRLVLLAGGRPEERRASVTTKTISSTAAQSRERVCSCPLADVWSACVSDGIAIVAAASSVRVEIVRARTELNVCVPLRSPPTTNAIPSTSTLFARIEPTSAAWTTLDEALVQREQRDEELGQVAERRLDDAGAAGAEPGAELLGRVADLTRERGERDGAEREGEHLAEPAVVADCGDRHERGGDRELDRFPTRHGPEDSKAAKWGTAIEGSVAQRPGRFVDTPIRRALTPPDVHPGRCAGRPSRRPRRRS